MGKSLSMVKEYATIAFTLLGVLFGMMIMTFIFGQLGHSNTNTYEDLTGTKINESDNSGTVVWLNQTGYTLIAARNSNFTGASITSIMAADSGVYNKSVPIGNYTLTSTGILRNATVTTQANVSVSYTWSYNSDNEITSVEIENNSLQGIVSYTDNSSTQFNTVSIAVILILLIGVFLLFWNIFVSNKKKVNSGGNFA